MTFNVKNKDVLWGYLSQILNSGINLLLLPFILISLSPEKLGLWYNFIAISSLVMLLDFGFSITITRNVAYAWSGAKEILKEGFIKNDNSSEPNLSLFKTILKTSKLIYLCMAIISLLILVTIGTNYITNIAEENIKASEYLPAWYIFIIAIFLNLYYLYWTPFLRGVGAIKQYYQVMFFSKFIQLLLTIVGLFFGFELLAVSIAYLGSVIISRIISKLFFYNYNDIKKQINEINSIEISISEIFINLKTLWSGVYKQGILSMSNYMIDKTSILICTSYFGLITSSQYGLTLQALGVITTISNVFYNSYLPKMIYNKTNNKITEAYNILCKSVNIQVLIIFIGSLGVLFLAPYILNFIGSKTSMLSDLEILVLIIYILIFNFQTLFTNYIIMDNKYPMVKAYILTGFFIILLEILSVNIFYRYGVITIILAQLFTLLFYNAWKWPMYVAKAHKKSFGKIIVDCINGYKI